MAERHQMRALGRKSGNDGVGKAVEDGSGVPVTPTGDMADTPVDWLDEDFEAVLTLSASPSRSGLIAAALAVLSIAAWTGFYLWAYQSEILAGATPARWAGWIVAWSVPVALIGVMWLLAMRSSQAEAHRFAAAAAALNRESAALETRLQVVNRELSLAREFLAAQARDLEALGRIAVERLSGSASELQELIVANGAQVEAIGATSETALGNMNRLRDDLPVIANSTRDLANQIGNAGHVAEDQLARLGSGFDRFYAAGKAGEEQVIRLTAQVGDTLSQFEAQLSRIEAIVTQRFATLQEEAEGYRTRITMLESEALDAQSERARAVDDEVSKIAEKIGSAGESARVAFADTIATLHENLMDKLKQVDQLDRHASVAAAQRISQLRDEALRFDEQISERNRLFDELIEQRQAAFEMQEAQATEVLGQRLAALDEALAERREAQLTELAKLVAEGEAMSTRVSELGRLIGEVGQMSETSRESLGIGIGTLAEQLADKRATIASTEAQLAKLTESSVRLLEILQSSARACREDLTLAIDGAGVAIEDVEQRAGKIEALMLRSTHAGSDLSDYLVRTRAEIESAELAIAGFKSRLGEEADDVLARLQGLRGGFARLAEESGALGGQSQETLREALGALETAITEAFSTLDTGVREKTRLLAESIGGEAVEALERALRNESAATIGRLEQAAAHASGVGREAAIQLRDQLVKVNELTGNLEQRVMRARELAEEQINNDFTRRMALITDSLNSAAIDISAALSAEVTDTAWDAYLKGDRGIFTRRALRLIDNGTARQIAALYTSDEGFKANVGRYIHDFEALLRQTLSTRDGHVLSVTMLGSDMGKLYVALAQAIQRFRD